MDGSLQREYFEKANSLFSGVINPSSSSYNKVSTHEVDGAAQRLRWGKEGIHSYLGKNLGILDEVSP